MADDIVFASEKEAKSGFGMGDKSNIVFASEKEAAGGDGGGSSMLRRTVGDLGVALAKGTLVGIPETVTGLLDIPTLGKAGKTVEAIGKNIGIGGFQEGREYFDKMLTPETKAAQQKVSEAEGGWETLKTAVQNPSVIAQTVMESIPSMVAGAGVVGKGAKALGYGLKKITPRVATAAREAVALEEGAVATGAQARALKMAEAVQKSNLAKAAVIGGVAEGAVTAGQNLEQVRQQTPDQLLTPEQIALNVGAGAVTGAIGILSGKLANRLGLVDPQTFAALITNGGIARNVAEKETWKKFIADGLKTMAREGFLEELPQSMQEQVAQNLSLGKPIDDQVFEQGALGLLAGMAQAGGAHALSSAMNRMANDPIHQEITKAMAETDPAMKETVEGVPAPEVAPLGETAIVKPTVETPPAEVSPAETEKDYSKTPVIDILREQIASGKISMMDLGRVETAYQGTEVADLARAEINRRTALTPPAKQVTPEVAKLRETSKGDINRPVTTGNQLQPVVAQGSTGVSYTFKGEPINFNYGVVEADDLVVSHNERGVENPAYPQEFQKRKRDREQMKVQVEEISRQLTPDRVAESPSVSGGAPIIGGDMVVESGNGRVAGIKLAYKNVPEKGQAYKTWLVQNAAKYGLNGDQISAMKQPVLVRERTSEVDREAFADVANVADIAGQSPAEIAKADAELIDDEMIGKLGIDAEGNVLAASNRGFLTDFLGVIGTAQATALLDEAGQPTIGFVNRVKAALFSKAYQDEKLISMMAEEADPEIKNIVQALVYATKTFVKLNTGKNAEDPLNPTKDLTEAVHVVRQARKRNWSAKEYVSQQGLFGQIPQLIGDMAIDIDSLRNKPAQLRELINGYGEDVLEEMKFHKNENLFEVQKKTKEEMWGKKYEKGKGGIPEKDVVEKGAEEGEAGEGTFKASTAERGNPLPIQVISETKDGIMEISFNGEKPYPYRIPSSFDREKINTLLRNRNYKAAEKKIDESMDKTFRKGKPLTEEQKKTGLEKVREAMGKLKFSAAAYAGGPPLRGKRLSLEYAGSGTGVHMQGFGLYFASLKKVAEYYKGLIEGKNVFEEAINDLLDDIRADIEDGNPVANTIIRRTDNYIHNGQIPEEIDRKELLDAIKTIILNPESNASIRAYNKLKDLGAPYAPKAALYKVELAPDEDEYLLWDEPFNKQSKKVQNALAGMYPRLFSEKQRENWIENLKKKTGKQIYSSITSHEDNSIKRASARLREVGIRGNKYLDQGSRLLSTVNEKVEPTYNYVIFSDEDVEIKEVMASVTGTDKRIMEKMSPEDRKKAEDAVEEKLKAIDPADYEYVSPELKQQLDDEKTKTEVLHERAVIEGKRWRVGDVSRLRERLERGLRNFKRFLSQYKPKGTHPELLEALAEERVVERAVLLLKLERAKTERQIEGIVEGAKLPKEVEEINARLKQIEAEMLENRPKGTQKINNEYKWADSLAERASLREKKAEIIEKARSAVRTGPDVARLNERIKNLTRDIDDLESRPKVFELDPNAYKNKWAQPAYELGASEGYEVVFIKDNYGFYNAFVNASLKKIYVRVDAAHDALKLVRHEVSHIRGNKHIQELVDRNSDAVQEYWKKWNKYSGVVGSLEDALEEYAADLQAGIEVNYGVTLKDGLIKEGKEYIGGIEGLVIQPRKVEVIAELPIYTEVPTAGRLNTHEEAVALIEGHDKAPMAFNRAIDEIKNKYGRIFKFKELADLLGRRLVEVSYDASKMTNQNAPAQYIKDENTIYLNPKVLVTFDRADDALDTALSFNAIMAIVEQSEKTTVMREGGKGGKKGEKNWVNIKLSYADARLKLELKAFKDALNPYLKDAPENVKTVYNEVVLGEGAKIKSILGLLAYPDVAAWLDTLPDYSGKGKGENSLWQRLKEIVLRAIGKISNIGRTKLDTLAEIMDKYVDVGMATQQPPNKVLSEARKYTTPESYIKAVSFTNTGKTTKKNGLDVYIYKNKMGATYYEPARSELQKAARFGWNSKKAPALQEAITKLEMDLKNELPDAKRSETELVLMRLKERLSAMVLPIQTEHERLTQIWRQAHGEKAKEVYTAPTPKRIMEETEAEVREGSGIPLATRIIKNISDGFSLGVRKEAAVSGALPVRETVAPIETLDAEYKPMATAWVDFLRHPEKKYKSGMILTEQDFINGVLKNISRHINEETTYDYITVMADVFLGIKEAVYDSVAYYNAKEPAFEINSKEKMQFEAEAELDEMRRRRAETFKLEKPFRELEKLSILEEEKAALPKAETPVTKTEKKPETGELILFRGNSEVANVRVSVKGEEANVTGVSLVARSYLKNMIARIFADHPDVSRITLTMPTPNSKAEKKAQNQMGSYWSNLGAVWNFSLTGPGEYSLTRLNFVKALTTPAEREVDRYTNQPKLQPANINSVLDMWLGEPTDVGMRETARVFAEAPELKVDIPKDQQSYLKLLGKHLSADEEADLIPKAKLGDKEAIKKIVLSNQGFIYTVAKKFNRPNEIMDLVQVGNEAYMKALRKFDPSKGMKLNTYAGIWVQGAISKYLKENFMVHPSIGQLQRLKAEAKGDPELLKMLKNLETVSFGTPVGEVGEEGMTLEDVLVGEEGTEEEKSERLEFIRDNIGEAMSVLDDRERYIIYNRYIIGGVTQAEIGEHFNVTKNRITQIEKYALDKLRVEMARLGFVQDTNASVGEVVSKFGNFVRTHLGANGRAVEKAIVEAAGNNYVDHPHQMKKEDYKRFRNILTSHGGIVYNKVRELLSLPFQNSEKSSDWRKLWDIFVQRVRDRDILSHKWLMQAKRFIHIQSTFKAAGLTKAQAKREKHLISRFLTIGDENLRNIRLALVAEIKKLSAELKKGGLLFGPDLNMKLAEAEAKLKRLDEEKRYSYEEAVIEGIDDDGKKIKLSKLGYDIYKEVRATEDEIFKAYMSHAENMLTRQYQKQKWYKALEFALGRQLSDSDILKIANKLQETSVDKNIEKINRKGIYLKYDDIFSRINKEFSNAESRGLQVQDTYKTISKNVAAELAEIKTLLQSLSGYENVDEAVKEMFIAYQMVRPRIKRIRAVRNEWKEWPGFFPRERTAGTRKFQLFEKYIDAKGVAKEREVFSQHFNGEREGLDIYSELVDRYGKNGELPERYRWDAVPVVKTDEGSFEGVKDFNLQAIIESAFENMKMEGGKFFDAKGKEVDIKGEVWDAHFDAIAGQFQARGAQAHGIHRRQAPGEKAIKGYLEVDLDQVLKKHITSMAGLITKQEAAYSALEVMSDLDDKTRAPELREYIRGQLRNDTSIDRISTKIRTFAFIFFLGGMFKSAAVNSTQPIIVGIPELDRYIRAHQIGKVSGTMAQLRASRLVALHPELLTKDPDEWVMEPEKPGYIALTNRSNEAEKILDERLHLYLKESLINGMMMAQHLRMIKGEMSGWGGVWNKTFDVLATPFAMVEKYNRVTSGIAMFTVAFNNYMATEGTKTGVEGVHDKAMKDANNFIDRVHYAIGKHNLPIPAQSGTALGVGLKTAYTFRPFTHNFLLNQFNMLRSAKRLLIKQEGLTADQEKLIRAEATNDLKTVLHTMFLMAIFGGMMGLPFFKDLSDFYEKHFGYSPKEWLRSALRGIGGQGLETLGMSGVPGLLGADMSGSLAIGVPFLGDQDSIDSVFGVYAGLGKKLKMAGQAASRGDYYRVTANLAPEFLRSPIVALTESDFGKGLIGARGYATTPQGMPSYSSEGKPLKYEGMEIPVKMLGFQPTRFKREREVEQYIKKQVMWANDEKRNISESFRIDRLQGDPKATKTMMESVRELNKKIKERNIPVPLANMSTIVANSRKTKNLQKRRELARRFKVINEQTTP